MVHYDHNVPKCQQKCFRETTGTRHFDECFLRAIATHLVHKAGYTKTTAQTGAVTLIQCFGGALNLNIHYHMLFLD